MFFRLLVARQVALLEPVFWAAAILFLAARAAACAFSTALREIARARPASVAATFASSAELRARSFKLASPASWYMQPENTSVTQHVRKKARGATAAPEVLRLSIIAIRGALR
jgi:hypothetical protein